MNQRFTMDRKSFEQFLAAVWLLQRLRSSNTPQWNTGKLLVHLVGLQQGIDAGSVDLESAMDRVAMLAVRILGATSAGVYFFRRDNEFTCSARAGKAFDEGPVGLEVLARLAHKLSPSESTDLPDHLSPVKASHYPGWPKSIVVAPLCVNGQVAGALAAFSLEFEAFSEREQDNLSFLANLLERALLKAVQAGYQRALMLEQKAVLQLAEQLVQLPRASRQTETAAETAGDHVFQEDTSGPPEVGAEEAVTSKPISRAWDTSIPGIGVRAALGEVREFTGEEQPSRIATAFRKIGSQSRQWANDSRLQINHAASAAHDLQSGFRHHWSAVTDVGQRKITSSARIVSRQVKDQALMRFRALRHFRSASSQRTPVLTNSWNSFRECVSWAASQWGPQVRKVTSLGKAAMSRGPEVQKLWIQLRRVMHQAESDYSALAQDTKVRVRVVWRRQAQRVISSRERAQQALDQAGQSFAAASGRTTSARRRPDLVFTIQKQALRKSGAAILVLSIMIGFVIVNMLGRSPFHAESASANTGSKTMPAPSTHAALTPRAVPVASSHLKVTDISISDSLHELTRYEIATLRRAADYGDDEAAFQLGMAYETGYYVPQNCAKAAFWVGRAADEGNPAAEYNLGLRYRGGDGVAVDEARSARWLQRASQQKYSPGREALVSTHAADPGNPGEL
jgi:GAF domain/Sel1 repeat